MYNRITKESFHTMINNTVNGISWGTFNRFNLSLFPQEYSRPLTERRRLETNSARQVYDIYRHKSWLIISVPLKVWSSSDNIFSYLQCDEQKAEIIKSYSKHTVLFYLFSFVVFSPILTYPDYPVSGKKSVQIPEDSPLTLNITLNEDHKSGSISALVEWDHPPIPFKSPSILYDIHWFLNDCNNVYDSSPECHKTPEHHANTVSFRSDDKVRYRLNIL